MKINIICRLIGHKFLEWRYVSDSSCTQIRICERDGFEERKESPHSFSDWKYVDDQSCQKKRVCSRCGKSDTTIIHQWNPWVTNEKSHVRKCLRDHAEERGDHDFSNGDTCPTCGGEGGYETLGGYGNNPKEEFAKCHTCDGSGLINRTCGICGAKEITQ